MVTTYGQTLIHTGLSNFNSDVMKCRGNRAVTRLNLPRAELRCNVKEQWHLSECNSRFPWIRRLLFFVTFCLSNANFIYASDSRISERYILYKFGYGICWHENCKRVFTLDASCPMSRWSSFVACSYILYSLVRNIDVKYPVEFVNLLRLYRVSVFCESSGKL